MARSANPRGGGFDRPTPCLDLYIPWKSASAWRISDSYAREAAQQAYQATVRTQPPQRSSR